MEYQEQKQRIDILNTEEIRRLTWNTLAVLTGYWEEEKLIKKIIAKSFTIVDQRELWDELKRSRRKFYNSMGRLGPLEPMFFKDIDADLECGFLIKDPDPPYIPPSVSLPTSFLPCPPVGGKGKEDSELPTVEDYKKQKEEQQQQEACQGQPMANDMQLSENDVPEEEKQDEKVLYNKVSFEFFLRLLEKAGVDLNDTGNKTSAGVLWHMMTGKSADELRRFCSTREYRNNHTKGDIKRLNELLSDMGITSIVLQ